MSAPVFVVVGGQFGSEGKGAFTAALFHRLREMLDVSPLVVRTGGPNAGHTVQATMYSADEGREWKLRCVPVSAVLDTASPLAIAAGSEIDPRVLEDEVRRLDKAGHRVTERLVIDRNCTLIAAADVDDEVDLVQRIGSTGKGIGAARAHRIMRNAATWGGSGDALEAVLASLDNDVPVIIEATQGYGLGMHTDFYPHTTSRDCRAIDVLSEVGVSPWAPEVHEVVVYLVMRPYPIRVAGNSGPLQGELDWETLGIWTDGYIKPEQTTVTGKTRRVGAWDPQLARAAVQANGLPYVALMQFDYLMPSWEGRTEFDQGDHEAARLIRRYEQDIGVSISCLGTGPDTVVWR